MSRNNWAENYSNSEDVVFKKGHWTLTEDGEKTKSLYFDDCCVESVLLCNSYKLLENGFIIYTATPSENEYILYFKNSETPVFKIAGKDVKLDIADDYITFMNNGEKIIFDAASLVPVSLDENDQFQINF